MQNVQITPSVTQKCDKSSSGILRTIITSSSCKKIRQSTGWLMMWKKYSRNTVSLFSRVDAGICRYNEYPLLIGLSALVVVFAALPNHHTVIAMRRSYVRTPTVQSGNTVQFLCPYQRSAFKKSIEPRNTGLILYPCFVWSD